MPRKRVKRKSEDLTSIEDKFKLSILNMDKRFVDLEMTISELSEGVKSGNVKSLRVLNQRVEDIEDLILVERAGLVELKGLMESVDGKFEITSKLGERFEKRFDKKFYQEFDRFEEKIGQRVEDAEALVKLVVEKTKRPIGLTEKVRERIALIEKDVAGLKRAPTVEATSPLELGELRSGMHDLEAKMSSITKFVNDLKYTVDEKIRAAVKDVQVGTAGFEFMNSKIESLKAGIDVLSNKRGQMVMSIDELEEKINTLEISKKDSLSDNLLSELKMSKRELAMNKIKIESLERVVRELTTDMRKVGDMTERFKSFEQLVDLKKDVDEKLRRFKFMEEEMTRLTSRVEIMYDNLDKRFMDIRNRDVDTERLSNDISEITKTVERVRVDVKDSIQKKDLRKIAHVFEEKLKYIESVEQNLEMIANEVDQIRGDIKKSTDKKDLGRILNTIEDKVKFEVRNEFKKRKVQVPEGKRVTEGSRAVLGDLNMRVSEIEATLKMIYSSISQLSQRPQESSIYGTQLKDLVDKFIFLDSRLAAMESILQKPKPIVLE